MSGGSIGAFMVVLEGMSEETPAGQTFFAGFRNTPN